MKMHLRFLSSRQNLCGYIHLIPLRKADADNELRDAQISSEIVSTFETELNL